jgi:hypothetical protein
MSNPSKNPAPDSRYFLTEELKSKIEEKTRSRILETAYRPSLLALFLKCDSANFFLKRIGNYCIILNYDCSFLLYFRLA